ncbi:MAG TPA: hypothetical protein VLC48_10935 [Gemmatimonadota bacterium]|nr:hypothetical protein [Gemmatimonadota bacterium]
MMLAIQRELTRRVGLASLGAVLLLAFAGCAREDQNKLVIVGPDSSSAVAPLAPGTQLEPAGDMVYTRLITLDFNLSNPDAFGRATSNKGLGHLSNTYLFNGYERNSSNDYRLPALGGSGTEACDPTYPSGGCRLGDATYGGGTHTDWWSGMTGFSASTDYVLVYTRYRLDVRGQLDTPEMLIFGSVAQPDSLIPLDGVPSGYETSYCNYNFGSDAALFGVTGTQNPFVTGFATSDASGYLEFDCLVNYNGLWNNFGGSADGVPMAPNTLQAFSLPRYNYVEVYENAAIPNPATDAPVFRIQTGIDLDASGQPIPNSYGPLPTVGLGDAVGLADAATSTPDSVVLTLDYLTELEDLVYTLWAKFDDGSVEGVQFEYTASDGTGIVEGPTVATSIGGGPYTYELRFDFPADTSEEVQFFVSIGEAAAATASDTQPLFNEEEIPGVFPAGTTKSLSAPDILFGTFDLGGADQRVYVSSGRGSGGLFGPEFIYDFESLPRPPVGYQYVGYLAGPDSVARLPDESFTSPPREYAVLTDADVETDISSMITSSLILEARNRLCTGDTPSSGPACAGPYDLSLYTTYYLTLEAKDAVGEIVGPTRVLTGTVPAN